MKPREPRRIKRIGLVIELEDGGRVMVYAEPKERAEVTIETKRPDPVPWDHPAWRAMRDAPSRTSILIEGLDSYRITETSPAMANHMLEAMDHGVRPDDGGPYIGLRP